MFFHRDDIMYHLVVYKKRQCMRRDSPRIGKILTQSISAFAVTDTSINGISFDIAKKHHLHQSTRESSDPF